MHYKCFPFFFFFSAGVQKCTGTDHQFCLRDVLSLTSRPAHSVHLWPHGVLPQHQWPHRLCYSGMDFFTRYVLSLTRKEWHHLFCCVLPVAFEWVKPGGSRAAAEVIQPGGQLHHQPLSVHCCSSEAVPFLPHSQSRADGTSLRWVCHSGPVNWGKPWECQHCYRKCADLGLFWMVSIWGFLLWCRIQTDQSSSFLSCITPACTVLSAAQLCVGRHMLVHFRYSWFCCQYYFK